MRPAKKTQVLGGRTGMIPPAARVEGRIGHRAAMVLAETAILWIRAAAALLLLAPVLVIILLLFG